MKGELMLKYFLISTTILMAGCADAAVQWEKTGVPQQEADQDYQQCLKESQQQKSSAGSSGYGGYGSYGGSSTVTNQGLFDACMAAKGYAQKNPDTGK